MNNNTSELPMDGLPPAGKAKAKHGRFTGETLADVRAEDGERIKALWAESVSVRKLADAFGISQNTIRAFLETQGLLSVDALKRRIQKNHLAIVVRAQEEILERSPDIPMGNIGMIMDVALKGALLINGDATEIREHRHVVQLPQELQEFYNSQTIHPGAGKVSALRDPSSAIEVEILPAREAIPSPDSGPHHEAATLDK